MEGGEGGRVDVTGEDRKQIAVQWIPLLLCWLLQYENPLQTLRLRCFLWRRTVLCRVRINPPGLPISFTNSSHRACPFMSHFPLFYSKISWVYTMPSGLLVLFLSISFLKKLYFLSLWWITLHEVKFNSTNYIRYFYLQFGIKPSISYINFIDLVAF